MNRFFAACDANAGTYSPSTMRSIGVADVSKSITCCLHPRHFTIMTTTTSETATASKYVCLCAKTFSSQLKWNGKIGRMPPPPRQWNGKKYMRSAQNGNKKINKNTRTSEQYIWHFKRLTVSTAAFPKQTLNYSFDSQNTTRAAMKKKAFELIETV